METQNNFAIGSIPKHIMSIAGPMIVAQLINVLYNVIDRIYIGRIPHVATLAMGGLGICLPIISIVMAFANLFGMGGSPLCSIARGQGKNDDAEEIMGNSFSLLVISGIILTIVGFIFKEDMAPVTSLRCCVEYPTTTTSFMDCSFSSRMAFISFLFFM